MSDDASRFAVGDIVQVMTTDATREMGMAGNVGVITEIWSSSEVQVDWSQGKPCIDPCYLNHVDPSWLCRWYLEAMDRAKKAEAQVERLTDEVETLKKVRNELNRKLGLAYCDIIESRSGKEEA